MIIREFTLGATLIKIDDEFMAKTDEENQVHKENLDSVMYRINEKYARKETKEEE